MYAPWHNPRCSPCLHLSLPHSICHNLTCFPSFPNKHTDLFSCCCSWVTLLWSFSGAGVCLLATHSGQAGCLKCDKCHLVKSKSWIQAWKLELQPSLRTLGLSTLPNLKAQYTEICVFTGAPLYHCCQQYRCISARVNAYNSAGHLCRFQHRLCIIPCKWPWAWYWTPSGSVCEWVSISIL